MPRPPVRTRGAPARVQGRDGPAATADQPVPAQKAADPSSDIYGVSEREMQRRAKEAAGKKAAAANAREQSASSDIYGVSDRELKRRASARIASAPSTLRTAPESRDAQKDQGRDEAGEVASRRVASAQNPGTSTRRRRGPDASAMEVVDDEMFGDMDTDFDDPALDSSPPPANQTETSSLHAGSFQRGRSRQSSIVGRDDAPIRPSSRGANTPSLSSTFNLGAFRRRPRQPSILGRRGPGSVVSDQEGDADTGFAPEAESTPLDRGRIRPSGGASTTTRSAKRKSPDGQGGAAKRQAVVSDDGLQRSIEVSSSPRTPDRAGRSRALPVTPVVDDSILAPPDSSGSSDASPMMLPSLKALTRVRRGRPPTRAQKTPEPDDDASDMSSPPSLTHSPNYQDRGAATKRKTAVPRREPSPVMTAALTSLLPQRRKKAKGDTWTLDSDEELDTSALGQDDDELGATSRRTRAKRSARPLAVADGATAQQTPKKGTRKATRRKYGSRTFSDKENVEDDDVAVSPLPDDTFDVPEGDDTTLEVADELKKAAKKFKEVDKWELEFEEVTPHPSSPQNAR